MDNLDSDKFIIRSKPSAGRTMVGLYKEYGTNLHLAHLKLINEFKRNEKGLHFNNWLEKIILFRHFENDVVVTKNKFELISSTLILNWISGVILNEISENSDLIDAEKWFNKTINNQDCLSTKISENTHNEVLRLLNGVNIKYALDLLPYIFEVFETGNEVAKEIGANRVVKKNNGIYYTPSDVIDFIINRSIINRNGEKIFFKEDTWYDPALGTGSFLINVLKNFASSESLHDNNAVEIFTSNNLFGTDVSPLALQSATYLLAINCIIAKKKGNPQLLKDIAKKIGNNLVLIDATTIIDRQKLSRVFPQLKDGVDFIISNPPYSKKQQSQLNIFGSSMESSGKTGDELYPDFVKMVIELTKIEKGGGGMVVPLSLSSNTKHKFKNFRKYIQSKKGSVEYWNFDRTPDSLFGDDVKTRNTILFYTHNQSFKGASISSSYLHRWNSRNRNHLFNSIQISKLKDDIDITDGVPKVGDEFGVNLLNNIRDLKMGRLAEILKPAARDGVICTKSTAYNWLPVELYPEFDSESNSGKTYWTVESNTIHPSIAYALLNSRLCYWLWRVWSDGFHLNNQFINNLPFGKLFFDITDRFFLKELGDKLWINVQSEKIISKNAGVISYSYCPLKSEEILDQIDKVIFDTLQLSPLSLDYLKFHINKLIIAGRESETTITNKIKYIELIK